MNILQKTSDPTLRAFEVHILGATPTIEPYRMHKKRSESEASSRDRKPENRFFDISKTFLFSSVLIKLFSSDKIGNEGGQGM